MAFVTTEEANGDNHFKSNQELIVNDDRLDRSVAMTIFSLWHEDLPTCSCSATPGCSRATKFPLLHDINMETLMNEGNSKIEMRS